MDNLPQVNKNTSVNISKKYIYLAIAILSFLLMSWVFFIKPPFSSPDEATHLFRANSIAHGYLMLKPIAKNGTTGGEVNENLGKAVITFNNYIPNYSYNGYKNYNKQLSEMNWSNKTLVIGLPTTAFYIPAVYFPQALSFFIGEKLNLSVYSTYVLLNYITLGICLALILIAYKIFPIPLFSMAIILLPMSLYQLYSPTIDGISLSLALLAMSLFMKLVTEKNGERKKLLLLALSVCIIIAAGSRANLLFMIFIPLWLFFVNKDKSSLVSFAAVSVLTLAWIAFSVTHSQDNALSRHEGLSNAQLISYYIKNPLVLVAILLNTLTDPDKIQFYYQSFIGNLGHLDAPVNPIILNIIGLLVVSVLIVCLIFGRMKARLNTSLFIVALSVVSLGLIFAALLVQWSPFPTNIIDGVQGRYFLIPLAILGYALPDFKNSNKIIMVALVFAAIFSTYVVRITLIDRYQNTINVPQEENLEKESTIFNIDDTESYKISTSSPNGKLKSVSVLMANYKNTAKGNVQLQVCSMNNCSVSVVDISDLHDNSYYKFDLSPVLKVTNKSVNIEIKFIKQTNSNPVALWLFPEKNNSKSTSPKMQFKFEKIE